MKVEPLYFSYRLEDGSIMYRDIKRGRWAIVREADSEYNPSGVKTWHDTMLEAEKAYRRGKQ